jgi:hypothetical protein
LRLLSSDGSANAPVVAAVRSKAMMVAMLPAPRRGPRHRQRDPHNRSRYVRCRRRARHRRGSGRWGEVAQTARRRLERAGRCDGAGREMGTGDGGERASLRWLRTRLAPSRGANPGTRLGRAAAGA